MRDSRIVRNRFTRAVAPVAALAFAAIVAPLSSASAWTYHVLYNFCSQANCADGSYPLAGLIVDSAGNLFGTTANGGAGHAGVVFELAKSGNIYNFETLHSFCTAGGNCSDGATPWGRLALDNAAGLYGTTYRGGLVSEDGDDTAGTVFALRPYFLNGSIHWILTTLHNFCSQQNCADGFHPQFGLTYPGASTGAPYDGHSALYGTAFDGGPNNDGAVYRISNNAFSVIYSPSYPLSGLTVDNAGHIFGSNYSTMLELSPYGRGFTETTLHTFGEDDYAGYNLTDLTLDANGNLFAATAYGASFGYGSLFKLVPNGVNSSVTVLHYFCSSLNCADGASGEDAGRPMVDSGGNVFGVATYLGPNNNAGVAFERTAGGYYIVLHAFCSPSCSEDGYWPQGGMVADSSGNRFGVTYGGGAHGTGIIYELSP